MGGWGGWVGGQGEWGGGGGALWQTWAPILCGAAANITSQGRVEVGLGSGFRRGVYSKGDEDIV